MSDLAPSGAVYTGPPLRVLYVCTANQCRSPFAEATLRREAAGSHIDVASAGFLSGERSVPPRGVKTGRKRGLDLSQHRSQSLDDVDLDSFDLILTAERRHARDIVADHPDLAARVFTIKQFDRWAPENIRPKRAAFRPWLNVMGAQRSATQLLGASEEDDSFDPMESSSAVWRDMSDTLDAHARGLISWLTAR